MSSYPFGMSDIILAMLFLSSYAQNKSFDVLLYYTDILQPRYLFSYHTSHSIDLSS